MKVHGLITGDHNLLRTFKDLFPAAAVRDTSFLPPRCIIAIPTSVLVVSKVVSALDALNRNVRGVSYFGLATTMSLCTTIVVDTIYRTTAGIKKSLSERIDKVQSPT